MLIQLKKFGTTLLSRQAGKEALAAYEPTLREIKNTETVEIDFEGVNTFAPSWADEFLTPLLKRYEGRFKVRPSNNPAVRVTINFLEKIHHISFPRERLYLDKS
ncbi:MAG: hypothetical protein A3B74_01100 [Candidatus Kerfeldbacteria bacterium RIFCSPHIGHO2_02_FULL_42_14]|uniref:DUF4325 domain-containing protein n=1 Tax=Candidatus Kerfeldbacteria bacterium RIFCSPHIGHO2_02_FULL_42_14 TaxID=1798540 RepID=A0A1G2ASB1_9BACT|nr:MAG: hypothetical protein A3B74_01100 [Candidatus Kerfeldbacteria bacterium RIFCSPHIGHO2_02_FULL_42_14]OGY81947.1 MAG: hypothetical protein A3E60_01180 [Candidatus Kerfeldbacteria bacterium RIFCSPHIGHO2_12_FULL_42_13]OGY83418.1 MAG: hypothetical protein A3I91_02075 [Candidatus Kerfeldbacteria bacterium RIFCSPLOWO2_02_FULL_42_19]OGY85571.1 MAG: hypothetical protein A3G01_03745 [Candidatus Kerfeldbacteria bacterium RIFCSPLOWO2_12_FULL_43_9]